LPSPNQLDSISFLPAILGDSEGQSEHDYLYWEFYERGSAQAIRMGQWKGVRRPMFTGTVELYNLESDLGEKFDVAREHPEIVERAAVLMEEAHVTSDLWKIE